MPFSTNTSTITMSAQSLWLFAKPLITNHVSKVTRFELIQIADEEYDWRLENAHAAMQ